MQEMSHTKRSMRHLPRFGITCAYVLHRRSHYEKRIIHRLKAVSCLQCNDFNGISDAIMKSGSSTRTQLDLLEQLTSSSSPGNKYQSGDELHRTTIREQLSELSGLPSLTISQKRNIKRQAYMNEVECRNDSRFFATIGAFVILPPIAILSVAILIGYVQLFP